MQYKIRILIRKFESGIDTTFQGIGYISLMVVLLALVWDFGRLAYINSICLNAARVAAQDAAKNIDKAKFVNEQIIELKNEAQGDAEATFRALTDISVPVSVELVDAADAGRSRFVHVTANVPVKLFMLGQLYDDSRATDDDGNPTPRPNALRAPLILKIEAYAEPAYGIDEEIQ